MAGDDETDANDAAKAGDEEEEDEEDLEKLQAEIARMEAEAARITKETEQLQKKKDGLEGSGGQKSASNSNTEASRDGLSIYVGQVDYTTTPEELLSHFQPCGTVERVTIVCDKLTGRPKGFAYLEFQNDEAVELAIKLDGSEFKGRQLKGLCVPKKRPLSCVGGVAHLFCLFLSPLLTYLLTVSYRIIVTHKRVNIAGFSQAAGGRGRGRGGFRGRGRGRGRGGFRGGGRGGYHPYY
jgi:polyadenylate-binding protein 2